MEELAVDGQHVVNYVLMWMCDIFSRGHGIAYKFVSIAVVSTLNTGFMDRYDYNGQVTLYLKPSQSTANEPMLCITVGLPLIKHKITIC